ncbi:L-rhamnose mutarotase [bacterium]|nr:L-rhamnose mutarotase [bacterium]
MARYGMIWKIKPELKEEYKKNHDNIWPDMKKALKDCGYRNYSIYFRKDGAMFAYLEHDNLEEGSKKLAATEVNTRWQNAMAKYFINNDPTILGPEIEMLEEVFHLD